MSVLWGTYGKQRLPGKNEPQRKKVYKPGMGVCAYVIPTLASSSINLVY